MAGNDQMEHLLQLAVGLPKTTDIKSLNINLHHYGT